MTKAVISSAEFHIVKDQVSNFAENSKMLLGVLDEIGKAHPFIQGQFSRALFAPIDCRGLLSLAAVVIFKAAIQLEVTRRENDDRVVTLNITMCDMMSVLRM